MTAPRKGGYRHLIYFIDGTWLWAGSQNTLDVYSNIYRMRDVMGIQTRPIHPVHQRGELGHAQSPGMPLAEDVPSPISTILCI
jgi:hypothetical protein